MARIGFDNNMGYLNGGIKTWVDSGKQLDSIASITPNKFVEISKVEKGSKVAGTVTYVKADKIDVKGGSQWIQR